MERILNVKKTQGFILENVEGLVNHNKGQSSPDFWFNLENKEHYGIELIIPRWIDIKDKYCKKQ